MADKKISDLQLASGLALTDTGVVVIGGVDFQCTYQQILDLISANLPTGAQIYFGNTTPQNNVYNNNDIFFNVTSQTFYKKISGTWVSQCQIASGTADGTVLFGTGAPASATGNNGDTYIDAQAGNFYKKASGTWTLSFSMLSGPVGPAGPVGPVGPAGANGNTILNGTSNPINSIGNNGDFYLNTNTYVLFGPKAAGSWPSTGTALKSDKLTAVYGMTGVSFDATSQLLTYTYQSGDSDTLGADEPLAELWISGVKSTILPKCTYTSGSVMAVSWDAPFDNSIYTTNNWKIILRG